MAGGWTPIVRNLLDTDFYKLLMLQMIREFYRRHHHHFRSLIAASGRLAEVIDEGELRAQLDHAAPSGQQEGTDLARGIRSTARPRCFRLTSSTG